MSPWLTLAIVIVILVVGTALAAAATHRRLRAQRDTQHDAQHEYDTNPELQQTHRPRHRAD